MAKKRNTSKNSRKKKSEPTYAVMLTQTELSETEDALMGRIDYWGDASAMEPGNEAHRHLMRVLTRILRKVTDSYKKSLIRIKSRAA